MSEVAETEPGETTNGSTEWVTPAVAASLSGIRLRELERAANKGQVRRKREGNKNGPWLYWVQDAIALATAPKAQRGQQETPEAQLAKAQADLFTKTALHLERSWALIHGPLLDTITELRTALKDSNAEVRALQAESREAEKLRRELENDAHVRQLAREELERDQKRKDEAFAGAKKAAAAVWPAVEDVISSFSLSRKLRETIDVSKVQALLDVPGMLDDREAALLADLFGLKRRGAQADAQTDGGKPDVETTAEPAPEATPDGGQDA